MKKTAILFTLLSIFFQAKAQVVDDAFKAEVAKAFELQKTDTLFAESVRLQMQYLVDEGKMTSENLNLFIDESTKFCMPLLLERMEELYKQYFTLDELKQMNAYLATPVGQKGMKVSPLFAAEGIKVMSSEQVKKKISEIVNRYLE